MYIYVYIYIYICMCISTYIDTCVHMRICICIFLYTQIYVYICIHLRHLLPVDLRFRHAQKAEMPVFCVEDSCGGTLFSPLGNSTCDALRLIPAASPLNRHRGAIYAYTDICIYTCIYIHTCIKVY